jgi:putative ABC transport system permease protein
MTKAGLLALLSHWRRNPVQLFTLVVGLSLATALWSGVQAVNAEARASYDAAAETLGEGQFAQITSDIGTISQADYIALRRAGWLVSPVIEGRLDGVRLIGLDALTSPGGIAPVGLNDGAMTIDMLTAGVLFATQDTLDNIAEYGVQTVASPDVAPGVILTDVGTAQRLLDMPDVLSRLIVAPSRPLTQIPLGDAPRAAGRIRPGPLDG